MELIRQQVRQALRRWRWDAWCFTAAWSLFASLWVAVAAVLVPKIWTLPFDSVLWCGGWLIFCVLLGGMVASVFLVWRGPTELAAAIELDRRSQSAERLSSARWLATGKQTSEMSQAVILNATRRAEQLDVAEYFPLEASLGVWPAVDPADPRHPADHDAPRCPVQRAAGAADDSSEQQRVEQSIRDLQQSLPEPELPIAKEGATSLPWLRELKRQLQSLTELKDRRSATVQLNRLADDLKQRRAASEDAEQWSRRLQALKNPTSADELARELQDGLRDATEQLDRQEGTQGLSDLAELNRLAGELDRLASQAQGLAPPNTARNSPPRATADQLSAEQSAADPQPPGNPMDSDNRLLPSPGKLADQLRACSECIQDGNLDAARDKLQRLAKTASDLQQGLKELEMIDQAIEQITQAKDSMNCATCNGRGLCRMSRWRRRGASLRAGPRRGCRGRGAAQARQRCGVRRPSGPHGAPRWPGRDHRRRRRTAGPGRSHVAGRIGRGEFQHANRRSGQ